MRTDAGTCIGSISASGARARKHHGVDMWAAIVAAATLVRIVEHGQIVLFERQIGSARARLLSQHASKGAVGSLVGDAPFDARQTRLGLLLGAHEGGECVDGRVSGGGCGGGVVE